MKNANLMLHCGADHVDREAVDSCYTPPATKTYFPLAHGDYVSAVERELEAGGVEVVNSEFGLQNGGSRMFGLLQVAANPEVVTESGLIVDDAHHVDLRSHLDDVATLVVGLRNAHDGGFGVGGSIGTQCFVCDNLAFSGEHTMTRRHTANLHRDLPELIRGMLKSLLAERVDIAKRFELYQEFELTDHHASDLMLRLVETKSLPANKVCDVLQEWRAPRHREFSEGGKTVWRLMNAVTECLKGQKLRSLETKTRGLQRVLDDEVNFVSHLHAAI